MAVAAQELRPRGAVGILDAAIRVCSRQSGVWVLTLPGAAILAAAAFWLLDARERHQAMGLPALALVLAWFARGVGQAAAAHHVEALVLGVGVARPGASARAALARLPSIVITVTALLGFHLLYLTGLGLVLPLLLNPEVAYGAVMTGKRHPLAIFATTQRLLGPTRPVAVAARFLFLVQGLVFFNVHIAAVALLYLLTHILGLDLTFAWSFVDVRNAGWDVAVLAVGFAMLEPLRAATVGLLLVDARVRQEGLGLIARVEQLPSRHTRRPLAAGVLVLVGAGLFVAPTAHAGALSAPARLEQLARMCSLERPGLQATLARAETLAPVDAVAFERFTRETEARVTSSASCAAFAPRLTRALAELDALERPSAAVHAGPSARLRARAVLARSEFYDAPADEAAARAEAMEDGKPSAFRRFLRRLKKLLTPRHTPDLRQPTESHLTGGLALAKGLAYVAGAVAVIVILFVLFGALSDRSKTAPSGAATIVALGKNELGPGENALSHAPDAWARSADALAARGSFLLALRSLYLAVLAQLHREGAIDYRVTQSNWDYVLRYRGPEGGQVTFRELTLRFDFSVYGRQPTGASEYRRFRELTGPILSRTGDPNSRGAHGA